MFLMGDGTGWDAVVSVVEVISVDFFLLKFFSVDSFRLILSGGVAFAVSFVISTAIVAGGSTADSDVVAVIVLFGGFLFLLTWVHTFFPGRRSGPQVPGWNWRLGWWSDW